MKIAVIGGGGFRVPMLYAELLRSLDRVPLTEVAFHDSDAGRMTRIEGVLEGVEHEGGRSVRHRFTTDLDAVLDGASFVLCAIRVGGLAARAVDERVPLDLGVVGQETTGPGGIAFALRTVPVMVELAERVARRAPSAWFVNFTNPAGLVTEALRPVLDDRVVGICDTPIAMCRRVAAVLGQEESRLRFDYFGLNHLGWLRGVYLGECDLLPGLLADDEALERLEEGRLFGAEWLRTLGMIPNEYLYFYDFGTDTVRAQRDGHASRGESLLRQQAAFYAAEPATPAAALAAWRSAREERERTYFAETREPEASLTGHEPDGGSGYAGEALAVVEAIATDDGRTHILNVANRSALPFLDARAVVEVPAVVSAAGVIPTAIGPVPPAARLLIETVKEVERLVIRAANARSRRLAVQALALHPLVPSVTIAREIFDAYAAEHPFLAGWSP